MSGASDPSGWIEKARQDARSAKRLLADPAELEPAAYHVQQAVEKALKAALVAEGIKFPRGKGAGHNLAALAGLIPAHLLFHQQAQMLSDLTHGRPPTAIQPMIRSRLNLFQRRPRSRSDWPRSRSSSGLSSRRLRDLHDGACSSAAFSAIETRARAKPRRGETPC